MDDLFTFTDEERAFLRTVLQNHIWDTSSNKQAIMAQELIDRLKDQSEADPGADRGDWEAHQMRDE